MKSAIFENIGMKISAVLIAVFLWFFVTSQGQSEMSLEAPLEFKNIPAELGISSASAKAVNLTIRGQERFMKGLNASDLRVFIDMGKSRQGETTYHLNKEDVKLPFAMTVMSVTPSTVRVKLEEIGRKTVNIQPQLAGMPERGPVLSVSSDPKSIVIKGLRSELRKIDMIKTEPVDISQVRGTLTEDVELDMAGMNITSDVSRVKVRVVLPERKR